MINPIGNFLSGFFKNNSTNSSKYANKEEKIFNFSSNQPKIVSNTNNDEDNKDFDLFGIFVDFYQNNFNKPKNQDTQVKPNKEETEKQQLLNKIKNTQDSVGYFSQENGETYLNINLLG